MRDGEGSIVLAVNRGNPKAPKLSMALKTWMLQLDKLESGEMSQAEYEAWKASHS